MPLKLKLVAGAVSLGTIVGIGYFASNKLLNNKQDENKETEEVIDEPKTEQRGISINSLIEERLDYVLLDSNQNPEKWEKNWQKYKENGQNVFNLEGWVAGDENLDLTPALKEKCKELSTNTLYDNGQKHYDNVTKYCGRALSFSEKASKKNLEVLDTTGTNHKQIWANKYAKSEELVIPLENLGFKIAPQNEEEIRKVCEHAKENDKEKTKGESNYESFETICTQPKVESQTS